MHVTCAPFVFLQFWLLDHGIGEIYFSRCPRIARIYFSRCGGRQHEAWAQVRVKHICVGRRPYPSRRPSSPQANFHRTRFLVPSKLMFENKPLKQNFLCAISVTSKIEFGNFGRQAGSRFCHRPVWPPAAGAKSREFSRPNFTTSTRKFCLTFAHVVSDPFAVPPPRYFRERRSQVQIKIFNALPALQIWRTVHGPLTRDALTREKTWISFSF